MANFLVAIASASGAAAIGMLVTFILRGRVRACRTRRKVDKGIPR